MHSPPPPPPNIFHTESFIMIPKLLQCMGGGGGRGGGRGGTAYLVVPDLHKPVICSRDEVRLVSPCIVVHAVSSFLVAIQREVRVGRPQLPHLNKEKHREIIQLLQLYPPLLLQASCLWNQRINLLLTILWLSLLFCLICFCLFFNSKLTITEKE